MADLWYVLSCYIQPIESVPTMLTRQRLLKEADIKEFYTDPLSNIRRWFRVDVLDVRNPLMLNGMPAVVLDVDDNDLLPYLWIVAAAYATLSYAMQRNLVVYTMNQSIGQPGTRAAYWELLIQLARADADTSGPAGSLSVQQLLMMWQRFRGPFSA